MSLSSNSPRNANDVDDFVKQVDRDLCEIPLPDDIYMHARSVSLRQPLKLMGKPSHDVYRIKHPKLRYSHIPIDFLAVNPVATSPNEHYVVMPKFRYMSHLETTCLCTYFGILNDVDNKCRHPMCLDTHTFLFNGVEQFIRECNILKKPTKMETVYTFFGTSLCDSEEKFDSMVKLMSKVDDAFWFEPVKDSNTVRIVGNAKLSKGINCYKLLSSSSNIDSVYDVRMNSIDQYNYPQLKTIKIIQSRLYLEALEGVSITFEKPIGSISGLSVEQVPILDHQLIAFEILNFKNSNWPIRAITDKIIEFFMKIKTIPCEVHWSFATVLVRQTYLLARQELQDAAEKKDFCKWLKQSALPEEDVKQMLDSLHNNRSFWFLAPDKFEVSEFSTKINLLLDSFTASRVLKFNCYTHKFDCLAQIDELNFCKSFFETSPVFKGELSLMLMKPNFQFLQCYQHYDDIIGHYAQIIDFIVLPKISDEQFSSLYENCLTRPYGPAWKQYMQSGPVVVCLMLSPDVAILRNKIVQMRKESKVVWIKNIAHASASREEASRDIAIFFSQETTKLEKINHELSKLYAIKPYENNMKRKSDDDDDKDLIDESGLPFDFPNDLKENPQFVSFMRYITDVGKRQKKSRKE